MSYEDIAFKIGYLKAREEELKFLRETYKLLPFSKGLRIIEERIKFLSQLEDNEVEK